MGRTIEVKIDGKSCIMAEHYENAVERDFAVIENGLRVSSHGFRRDFHLNTGMRFRTNGHNYEVVRGEDSWYCPCCGKAR